MSLIYRVDLQPSPAAPLPGAGAAKYRMQVVDSLTGMGVVRDLIIGESASAAPAEV